MLAANVANISIGIFTLFICIMTTFKRRIWAESSSATAKYSNNKNSFF